MAIERSIYGAPQGLNFGNSEAMEIEIEASGDMEPEITLLEDGGVEITLEPDSAEDIDLAPFDANLADYMDDGEMSTLAKELVGMVQADIDSRKDWAVTFVKGLEVQKNSFYWQWCNVGRRVRENGKPHLWFAQVSKET